MSKIANMLQMVLILSKRGRVKINELANRLEVSPKQVRRYRDALDQSGIYVDSVTGKYGGYELLDSSQALSVVKDITDKERDLIKLLSNINYPSIKELYDSMLTFFEDDSLNKISLLNIQGRDLYNLIVCHRHIQDKKKLNIKYQLNNRIIEFNFQPYFTYKKYNRWYVYGYSEFVKDVRQIKIANINELQSIEDYFSVSNKSLNDLKETVLNTSGVFIGGIPQEVKLELLKDIPQSDIELLLECKVTIEDNLVRFTTYHLQETARTLLRFGCDVQVVAPEPLIIKIKKLTQDINTLYEEGHYHV